ncbi:DUF1295 domain-containing protein [Paenibacillus sp. HB172176]|uniref:DUF1295 domain-containing protein n=1 Tax=Paenibacillus sp. HB172176 TaxID=2493690 RepID=UPI00143A487C|nr:DUF1295 domain-containing protein [Paenibacillus sp. HB172176]
MKTIYNKNTNHYLPRVTLLLLETIILAAACWILLFQGSQTLNDWFHWSLGDGRNERNILLFALIAIVYLRMCVTIFYLLKRVIPWEEAFTVPLAFSLYYVGFALFAMNASEVVDGWDLPVVLLFIAGSFINTCSEWLRDQWKKRPENKGKLYTKGLFRYSAHINYFGDLLWVLALALVTRNPWALIVPLLLFCLFAFYNIPMLDRHLESKYGEDFRRYIAETKKFIPFLY